MLVLLTVTVAQRAIGFGRGLIYCRWLTPESLGEWEIALSFLMLGAPLAVLGIPGAYGRFVEHYRARGQLRSFLRRTTLWTLVCGCVAVGAICGFAPQFSRILYGHVDNAALVRQMGVCLGGVILHHSLTSLLSALRLFRIVSAMSFAHSLLFAAISLALLWRSPSSENIVQGYGAACWLTSVGALIWTLPALRNLPIGQAVPSHQEFWPRLLRFALAIWVINLLANLFAVVDRYMLVHCTDISSAEAIGQVGVYHSSRVIPLMLVSVAELLSAMLLPHLTHDWENGHRDRVVDRVDFSVKIASWGLLAFATLVLAAGPLIFGVLLQGRYDAGLALMPWTLATCVWFGIHTIAQQYLWCAERTRLSAIPWLVGLIVNIALNLILLPLWGLFGAVLATAIATLCCVGALFAIGRVHGMRCQRGTLLALAAPLALGGGPVCAVLATAALTLSMLATDWILTHAERAVLRNQFIALVQRLAPLLPARLLQRATASSIP